MKKTIKGVVYDTDASTHIGFRYYGDFGWPGGYEEQLFVAENGRYFLYGIGGDDSPYAKPCIKLFSDKQAAEWKKEYCSE